MESFKRLRQLLNNEHSWPGSYTFKFVVPTAAREQAAALVPEAEISFRSSAGGKYVNLISSS